MIKEKRYKNIRTFPRPLLNEKRSYQKNTHDTVNNYEDIPSLFYPYNTIEGTNASIKYALSSSYFIPNSKSNLNKSNI